MPKGVPNKQYTPESKKTVVETMQQKQLSYHETCRRFDINNRDPVGYTIPDCSVPSMVTTMPDKALEKSPDGTNRILHSDQGWQYQHKPYQ